MRRSKKMTSVLIWKVGGGKKKKKKKNLKSKFKNKKK